MTEAERVVLLSCMSESESTAEQHSRPSPLLRSELQPQDELENSTQAQNRHQVRPELPRVPGASRPAVSASASGTCTFSGQRSCPGIEVSAPSPSRTPRRNAHASTAGVTFKLPVAPKSVTKAQQVVTVGTVLSSRFTVAVSMLSFHALVRTSVWGVQLQLTSSCTQWAGLGSSAIDDVEPS